MAEIDIRNQDFGTIVLRTTTSVVKKYPKTTAAYVIGLSVLLFATGFAVDATRQRLYQEQMFDVEKLEMGQLEEARINRERAYQHYYHSKGWFSCDFRCTENYQRYLTEAEKCQVIEDERNKLMNKARQTVGIFSEYGVTDARRMFWNAWERGKNTAKNMSWWDALFMGTGAMMGGRRRDEDGLGVILRLVGRVIMNFVISLFFSTVGFIWNLIWFVRNFEAGIGGVIFWILGSCAAFSMLASFILGMVAVVGVGAVAVVKLGDEQRRRGVGNRQQRRRVHYD